MLLRRLLSSVLREVLARLRTRSQVVKRGLRGQLPRRGLAGTLLRNCLLIQTIVHVAVVDGSRRHASALAIPRITRSLHMSLLLDDALRVGIDLRPERLFLGLLKVADCVLTAGLVFVPVEVALRVLCLTLRRRHSIRCGVRHSSGH